ncbi:unnamed protein product, partial [Didymodactylos carnosus]
TIHDEFSALQLLYNELEKRYESTERTCLQLHHELMLDVEKRCNELNDEVETHQRSAISL